MKIKYAVLTLYSLILLFSGCSREDSNNKYTYSLITGGSLNFDLENEIARFGHEFTSIKSCYSPEAKQCIKFDSTIIAIPNELPSSFSSIGTQGTFSSLELSYYVEAMELEIFGNKINGYLISIYEGDANYSIGTTDFEYKGDFFFSEKEGVVFFYQYIKYFAPSDPTLSKMVSNSHLNFLKGKSGLFGRE